MADFEQKAGAIAHAFEHGGFWQVLEIAPNFLKGLQYTCIRISKCLRDYLNGFRVNSLVSELGRFWAKAWAIAHAFEHGGFWQVLEIFPNFLKGLLYACKWISMCLRDYLNGFRVNSLVSELGRFWAKAWAIAHAFEHGGLSQVLEIAPNFLKRLLCACKCISNCLRDYLNGFRVNSPGSEVGRF